MIYQVDGKTIVLVLEQGEDIVEALNRLILMVHQLISSHMFVFLDYKS
jgi:predicted DNA-binding protein with PD1-like motif